MNLSQRQRVKSPIPAQAGIGLRPAHYEVLLKERPKIPWLEVHSENFFADGGQSLAYLEQVRQDYPLSLHGVGLSLGSTDPLNDWHINKLRGLIERYEPGLVSEHLCWNAVQGRYFNDLLPLPYTREALLHVTQRVEQVQEALGRQILIENLSSYLMFSDAEMTEWDFISELAGRSGCGVLLDINNIYVNAHNHHFDPYEYLSTIPVATVKEMHLAGHTQQDGMLIDTHSKPVCDDVWELYETAIERFGPTPTLIEWDCDIPAMPVLLAEAAHAQVILEARHADVA